MTHDELKHQAELDALGISSPYERTRFDLTAAQLDPEQAAAVRETQDGVSSLVDALPHRIPDATLKPRVLSGLSDAIQQDLAESVYDQALSKIESVQNPDGLHRFLLGRVSPVWRAACLVFAAIAVVSGSYALTAYTHVRNFNNLVVRNQVSDLLKVKLGDQAVVFLFHPRSRDLYFNPSVDSFNGHARLTYVEAEQAGFLRCSSLPVSQPDRPYRVEAQAPGAESPTLVHTFGSDGGIFGLKLNMTGRIEPGTRWTILSPDAENRYSMVLQAVIQ